MCAAVVGFGIKEREMADKPKYYITTAIAYTSGKPHIGNTYEIILADAIARYKRFEGYDVFFQTGTDEHGQKIEEKAKAAGKTPKEFVDGTAGEVRRIWDFMNTSYDKFIRTTDADHERQVQKIFRKLHEKGDIYKGEYKGMYCTECESFYTESQLKDGKCPLDGCEVHPAAEEAYFFKMSKYAPRLIDYINTHPEFIQPVSRKNEMMNNFLLPGLEDLCVSRTSFSWGVPVDFDPKHVVYVWLDALVNYITGIGYDADGDSTEQFKKLWPADLHLIGKDIIRFHTIYWPIFLMALDLPLPKQVFGHPWLLQASPKEGEEGMKMSKSRGNVLYADELADIFGVDAVRYFCLHEMPFENDGVISWDLMLERFNSDLANTLGNLVNRTVSMSNKYFGGLVEKTGAADADGIDASLAAFREGTAGRVAAKMEHLRVADAITEIFALFKRSNKYIDETEPWKLAKDEAAKPRLAEVLYNLMDSIATGASLLAPFMPETAEKIFAQIGCAALPADALEKSGNYPSGTVVTKEPAILFARMKMEDLEPRIAAIAERQTAAAAASAKAEEKAETSSENEKADAPAVEHKDTCTFDDFMKCEFRVGTIISCEAVKSSKKLLCSQVEIAPGEVVQICSGLRPQYTPEMMVGRKVMAIVNLAPRKMAGLMSQGMLLCAEGPDGKLSLMQPDDGNMPSGSEIC